MTREEYERRRHDMHKNDVPWGWPSDDGIWALVIVGVILFVLWHFW